MQPTAIQLSPSGQNPNALAEALGALSPRTRCRTRILAAMFADQLLCCSQTQFSTIGMEELSKLLADAPIELQNRILDGLPEQVSQTDVLEYSALIRVRM